MENTTTDAIGLDFDATAGNLEDLMAGASPALRATLDRCYSPQATARPGGFSSFVDADL
ncbi:hypothetical protein Ais01nite_01080 [Asanoa ishikariensis]|uniref:Uncharacterized protein n=1 Tax=Asanoa ishikariensis TaxID=137265 RepID=A0A1H3TNP7_9ACTN|nr:hypothetical protein [Asanoa ishikariensis]GIF62073.1 hypothetical protein Ais01nite_01080 [Asanoa ishikariensis]SDZ51836.1 hypothetical protein SAMN05421684_6114 [Asanoa ishikariensis]